MLDALSPLGAAFGDPSALAEIKLATAQERSDIGAVLVTATGPGADFADTLATALGCALPLSHGETTQRGNLRALWLSPRSWIVLCAPQDEAELIAAVAATIPNHAAHASRFSDALGWLTLDGAAVIDLLRQGGFVTLETDGLPIGHARRTLLAGIPAVILRDSETRWTIGVERSRTRYFVTWLAGLTHSFGDQG